MKCLAFAFLFFFFLGPSASAQTVASTLSADEDGLHMGGPAESAAADGAEERGIYEKKVGGIVWLEATAGPSKFDATRFRTLDVLPAQYASQIPSVVVSGPELGAALLFRAGSSTIGARFKRADYEPFDLTAVGLDLGFLIRAVPYVHPSIRLGFNYYTTTGGLPIDVGGLVSDARSHGGGATMGAGVRIPVIRWISLAANFDYSIIGLVFRGSEAVSGTNASFTAGTAGTSIAGNFALTFHLGG